MAQSPQRPLIFDRPGNYYDEDPIYAPNRTTLTDSVKSIQDSGLIPKYTAIDGVNNLFDDNYFKTIEDQATKKIQDKYFNTDDSLQNRLTNQMNKRGLIGSGIEAGSTNDLYKSFGDELVDLQSNIAQEKVKTQQDVAFRNKEIEAQNREFQGFLAELGLRAGADEAKTATDFDTKMFEQQVGLQNNQQKFISDIMDQLNSALGNKLIDKETRDEFESIFGTNIGNILGEPGTPAHTR